METVSLRSNSAFMYIYTHVYTFSTFPGGSGNWKMFDLRWIKLVVVGESSMMYFEGTLRRCWFGARGIDDCPSFGSSSAPSGGSHFLVALPPRDVTLRQSSAAPCGAGHMVEAGGRVTFQGFILVQLVASNVLLF